MTEPRTEAGKRLDSAWPGTHLDRLAWHEAIVRVEAEATAAAEQRLRTSIAEWREPEPRADMERGWNRALDAVLALLDSAAPSTNPTPISSQLAPASPRQGEPVDVERLGFTDLLAIGRALLEHYPPDTIVCSHSIKADIGARTAAAITDLIDSCAAALSPDPAEPVAPEGTG